MEAEFNKSQHQLRLWVGKLLDDIQFYATVRVLKHLRRYAFNCFSDSCNQ